MKCYTVNGTFLRGLRSPEIERAGALAASKVRGLHAAVELRVLCDPPRDGAAAHAVAESQRSQVARLRLRRLTPRRRPEPAVRGGVVRQTLCDPRGERGAAKAVAAGQNLDNRRVVRRQIRRRAPRGREARQLRAPPSKAAHLCRCGVSVPAKSSAPSKAEPHVTFWRCARSHAGSSGPRSARRERPMDSWRTSNARSAKRSQQRFHSTLQAQPRIGQKSRHRRARPRRVTVQSTLRHTMPDHAIRLRPPPTEDSSNPCVGHDAQAALGRPLYVVRRPPARLPPRGRAAGIYWLRPDGAGPPRSRLFRDAAAAPRGGSIPMALRADARAERLGLCARGF